jgi:hypothetical protein
MDLASDPWIISGLLGNPTNKSQQNSHLLGISVIDMRTDALQYLVLARNGFILMRGPVLFELSASLLVDFLFDIKFSLVEY